MKVSPTTEFPEAMYVGDDTTRADLFKMVNTHDDPTEYWEFIKELHTAVVSSFGSKTNSYLIAYEPSNELLFEIESSKRPSDFREAIEDFEFDGFNDYPVDLCRYCKNRRVPKAGGDR